MHAPDLADLKVVHCMLMPVQIVLYTTIVAADEETRMRGLNGLLVRFLLNGRVSTVQSMQCIVQRSGRNENNERPSERPSKHRNESRTRF